MATPNSIRIIDLTVDQFTQILNDSFHQNSSNTIVEEAPLTSEQAGAFLSMPSSTLYMKCRTGNLPHIKQGGRLFFFKKELIEWLKKHKVIPTEQESAEFFGDFKSNFNLKK
jgi:hypothetical protein